VRAPSAFGFVVTAAERIEGRANEAKPERNEARSQCLANNIFNTWFWRRSSVVVNIDEERGVVEVWTGAEHLDAALGGSQADLMHMLLLAKR
jgi:hypothetical protein